MERQRESEKYRNLAVVGIFLLANIIALVRPEVLQASNPPPNSEGKPDLVIENPRACTYGTKRGDLIAVYSFETANIGDAPAPETFSGVAFIAGPPETGVLKQIKPLLPGESQLITGTVRIAKCTANSCGTIYTSFGADVIDYGGGIGLADESREDNNTVDQLTKPCLPPNPTETVIYLPSIVTN